MAVKHIITHGYGFADGVMFIPTHGYSAGAQVATPTSGARYVFGAERRMTVPAAGRHVATAERREDAEAEG